MHRLMSVIVLMVALSACGTVAPDGSLENGATCSGGQQCESGYCERTCMGLNSEVCKSVCATRCKRGGSTCSGSSGGCCSGRCIDGFCY